MLTFEGTPVLALTGTASQETENMICSTLLLRDPIRLFVSPNRSNLRFNVSKVPMSQMLSQTLDWIVQLVKKEGIATLKTIIFCDTLYSVASVVNYLMMKLGRLAFSPPTSKCREHCLVGIFHSVTQDKYKKRIVNSLKTTGSKKIVIATSALSMGVNIPDIRYIVMYGPPRDMLDIHRKAGRAGRDGFSSHIIIYYHGQQVSHVDEEVREFLGALECVRVAAYKVFDESIVPLLPKHSCCNFCATLCDCNEVTGICGKEAKPYELVAEGTSGLNNLYRSVLEEDKTILKEALKEKQIGLSNYNAIVALGSTSCHGFSEHVISDVVENCHKIFSLEDVLTCSPIFSTLQALEVLSIISDIFNDIEELPSIPDSCAVSSDDFRHITIETLVSSEFTTDEDLRKDIFDLDLLN